ncbi:uncharacterized protein LOC110763990 [Prunus avium]|uniref:Uncharacterized protein LOC110763990 n=1 Tax=Prunus avium TaxID=42229 RepID=A0A6P5T640_PRUAV|nr:uncharacterized protein LOC110763990 [Prunus avium]
MAAVQRPRKRTLFTSSEGRGEEEAPPTTVSEAPPVIEEAMVEVSFVKKAAAAHMVVEEAGAAETTAEEAATAEEVAEALDAEIAIAEVPPAEEAAEGVTEEIAEKVAKEAAEGVTEEAADEDGEEAHEEAAEEVTDEAADEPAVDVPSGPLMSAPCRPSDISFRSPPQLSPPLAMVAATMPPMPSFQDSMVVAESVMTRATVVSVPSLLRTTSAVMTDLSLPEATSSDDLDELYASLHEEGGSSTSAPLDEDSKTVIEWLWEFLLLDVRQMTAAGAISEFRSCLDTAMALGLLDSAQLDELQARLAEGEEMIAQYSEAVMRMVEGSSLEQDLEVIKEQVQPAMVRLKENDLVVQRENEELAQVEAQIAELQPFQNRGAISAEPRDLVVWPEPDGSSSPAVHQLSFVLESRREPEPKCGRDSFPTLEEDDLPPYEAEEKLQCD